MPNASSGAAGKSADGPSELPAQGVEGSTRQGSSAETYELPTEVLDEAARLNVGAVDSLPSGILVAKLAQARAQGSPLRVKLGIDPTAPDIHLGHAVVLRKLRQFQDAGHRVILIIGDYTARVGDPSGRSELRPMLSAQEIEDNAASFQAQALRILDGDASRLEVRRNSEWLDMPMVELLDLVRTTTAAQLLERDDFAKRFAAHEPISVLELLYPLLQAYDSVAVGADVELGGTDQKFNLLLGRDIQRHYGRPEQGILTMPLLVGVDGRQKMSKSLGNQIGVTDPPTEMYGKAMSIPDEAVPVYRLLLLDDQPHFNEAEAPSGLRSGGLEPIPTGAAAREAKRALARDLIRWLYSDEDAQAAEQHFDRVFVAHEAPAEIEQASVAAKDGVVYLPGVMAAEFGLSGSQARRLIDQGAVTLGEAPVGRGEYDVPVARADGQVLKVGKRRFRRLRAG